jgi:hypothetical protein
MDVDLLKNDVFKNTLIISKNFNIFKFKIFENQKILYFSLLFIKTLFL